MIMQVLSAEKDMAKTDTLIHSSGRKSSLKIFQRNLNTFAISINNILTVYTVKPNESRSKDKIQSPENLNFRK